MENVKLTPEQVILKNTQASYSPIFMQKLVLAVEEYKDQETSKLQEEINKLRGWVNVLRSIVGGERRLTRKEDAEIHAYFQNLQK